jgi:hypothetical protein
MRQLFENGFALRAGGFTTSEVGFFPHPDVRKGGFERITLSNCWMG